MEKEQKTATIKEFARSDKDVGSVEVQVALLTKRIAELTEHLKGHAKDHSSRRGLIAMVSRRRRLLRYLETRSRKRYQGLITKLDLRH